MPANDAVDPQSAAEWSPWDPMLNEAPTSLPNYEETFHHHSSQESLGSYFGSVSVEKTFSTGPKEHSSDHKQSQHPANEHSVTTEHEKPSAQREIGIFNDEVDYSSWVYSHPHEAVSGPTLRHVVTDAFHTAQVLEHTHLASNIRKPPLPTYLPQQAIITHPVIEGITPHLVDVETQSQQIQSSEAGSSSHANILCHIPSQAQPQLTNSFASGVEGSPMKSLLFANNTQAQQAFTRRFISLAWTAPTPDSSLPDNDKKARERYVEDLVAAFIDLSEAQDLSRIKDFRIFYMSHDIETVCWELFSIAEKLHHLGPSSLRIFSKSKLVEAYKTRHMTFETRIAHICRLLRLSKSRCETILGYNDLETIVACPADKVRVAKSSKKLNTTRQHQLNEGRNTLTSQVYAFMQPAEIF